MDRLCIFAHWDKDNIIDDYVIYYLKALKEVCNQIIFVSDCDLEKNEIEKIKNITEYCIAQKHGEYDFGSYKRGFFFALNESLKFDELVFVNDSVYGPFYPLKPIFDNMQKKKCDFWGLTENRYGIVEENASLYSKSLVDPNIQSYFLVFRKSIIDSDVFINFMNNIKKENSKNDIIINYEIGLSKTLHKNNFKSAKYINKYKFVHDCTILKWNKLIKNDKYPFIKTSIIKHGLSYTGEVKGWENLIKSISDYPIDIIKNNSQRLLNLYENKYEKFSLYRKIRFLILKNAPLEIRLIIIFIEKYSFLILNTLCFNKLKKF